MKSKRGLFFLENTLISGEKTKTSLPRVIFTTAHTAFHSAHTKQALRGNIANEAKQAAKTWLTKWSADHFKNGIKVWKHRLEECIDLDGDYVEK